MNIAEYRIERKTFFSIFILIIFLCSAKSGGGGAKKWWDRGRYQPLPLRGPCICGEKMSIDFLKLCKLISNLMLGQIIVSNLTNVPKLNSRINYARLHWIRYKKQISHTIITQAYHSRCSFWKVSSKASIASEFSSKVKNENDAILNQISDFDKRRISQPKNQ